MLACDTIFRVLSVICGSCKTAVEAPAEASKADAQMFRLRPTLRSRCLQICRQFGLADCYKAPAKNLQMSS